VVTFTPWPLYSQGNSPWYPLLGGLAGLDAVIKRTSKMCTPPGYNFSLFI